MLRILLEEGFDIKERELMRVRAKNRWLLRVPNGTKNTSIGGTSSVPNLDQGLITQTNGQANDEPDMRELERAILVGACSLSDNAD